MTDFWDTLTSDFVEEFHKLTINYMKTSYSLLSSIITFIDIKNRKPNLSLCIFSWDLD